MIKANSYEVGDALGYLREFPAGVVAGVVSSPPYNRCFNGRRKMSSATTWKAATAADGIINGYAAHSDNLPWPEYVEQQRAVLTECLRIVGPAGVVVWNYKPHCRDGAWVDLRDDVLTGFPLRQELTWCRGGDVNQGGVNPTFLPVNLEKIYLLAGKDWRVPDSCKQDGRVWASWWRIDANADPKHPASFPLGLAVRLCGGAVLDPYAGSGTTGLAAARVGVDYYLNDNAAAYRAVFYERLARECQQAHF